VNMRVVYGETPAHMGQGVVPLVRAGASIIGGCCGSTPEHIAEFRRVLNAYLAGEGGHS
jgi:methionine synthase I (cobalamin-dependent)